MSCARVELVNGRKHVKKPGALTSPYSKNWARCVYPARNLKQKQKKLAVENMVLARSMNCLLYTSDAADE